MGFVKRSAVFLLAVFIVTWLITLPVFADNDEEDYIEEYQNMLDALPKEAKELFPSEIFSENAEDIAKGAERITDFGYIINTVLSAIGLELNAAMKLFATLMGIIILSAVMNAVKSSFRSSGVSEIFSVCSTVGVFIVVISTQYSIISSVSDFFSRICTFANAMLPLMGALYAMGGNVASAVANHSSLMIFMSIVENFCAKTVLPVSGVCVSFAAATSLFSEISLGGLASSFKKLYTNTLTFIMIAFGTVMAAQNLLASKTDNLAGKTAKFAVGNLIPVVGSAIAGTLGTVSTSIEYIRSSVGVIGIMAVSLMLLPTIATLLMTKLVLSLASGAAEILGCSKEAKLIGEMSGINGFLLAASCICSVAFVFMLTLFAKCTSAVGGGI